MRQRIGVDAGLCHAAANPTSCLRMMRSSIGTTAAFRAKNNGVLGRSTGCITLDPVENNELITRLQDGALVYVTVGDAPIEQYL